MKRLVQSFILILTIVIGSTTAGILDRQPGIVDDVYHAMTTVRDMYSLGIALEAYHIDNSRYPDVDSVEELRPLLEGRYVPEMTGSDAWGKPFKYVPAADGQGYRVVSAGSDGRFDERSWTEPGVFRDSEEDAVFAGRFIRKWAIDIP